MTLRLGLQRYTNIQISSGQQHAFGCSAPDVHDGRVPMSISSPLHYVMLSVM